MYFTDTILFIQGLSLQWKYTVHSFSNSEHFKNRMRLNKSIYLFSLIIDLLDYMWTFNSILSFQNSTLPFSQSTHIVNRYGVFSNTSRKKNFY